MWTWLTGSCSHRTDLLPDVSVGVADTNACKEVVRAALLKFSEAVDAGISHPRYMFDVIPGMNAIAFTREERPLGRVLKDGRKHGAEHHPSRRGQKAAPQDDG
jgi:hypothetical protein